MTTTKFFNFVDPAQTVTYDASGTAVISLQTSNSVDVTDYRKVSVRVSATSATSFEVRLGTFGTKALAGTFSAPVDNQIHTFDIVAPHMKFVLKGPPNTQDSVRFWIYLRD